MRTRNLPQPAVKWYKSRTNRSMFLRVRTKPVPMLTVINVPGLIFECKRFSIDDNGDLDIQAPLYALGQTIDEMFVQVRFTELPRVVRTRATW